MELKNCKESKSMNTILIYHQNICSVINKIDELYTHMQIDGIAPPSYLPYGTPPETT